MKIKCVLIVFLTIIFIIEAVYAQTKLLRFPDIHGDEVVFCYGGDIWKAKTEGGTAIRLTAHPGQEIFPKYSPDGKWIAFTGQYDGDEQVYIIPANGGIPKQLTYYPARGPLPPRWGYDNQVYGWNPDGKEILFRSLRDANGGGVESALYTVNIEGGLPKKLPMPRSGAGDYAANGSQIVYSPLFRDFRSWKRYEGGWAQDLYIFDLNTYETTKIASSKRSERDPMWIGNQIYFSSDRDGTLNLYVYDIKSSGVTQLTQNTIWDVRWPSSDNKGKIVYELNGEIQIFDVVTKQDEKLSIRVPDDGLSMRPSRYPAAKNIEDFELSPKGERGLFVARGDVFTTPIEKGRTRNLTNSSNAHDKWARWSPDGSQIAFISDKSGEEQVYIIDQKGEEQAKQLTSNFKGMLYRPAWSGDGTKLALSDKDGKIYVLTIATGGVIEVADDQFGRIVDYTWSPNGGYLAFSMRDWNSYRSIYIWSIVDRKTHRVTSEYFNAYTPSWDPGGKYLYFMSDRQFAPLISTWEWNFAGNRETGIFTITLRKDEKNPFAPESDEVKIEKNEKKNNQTDDPDKKVEGKKKEIIKIDFEGLAERVIRVPVEFDNMVGLSAIEGNLLYMKMGARFYGRGSNIQPSLQLFSIKDRKVSKLADNVSAYALSADGKKVLVNQKGEYNLYDVKPKVEEKKTISTAGLLVDRIPAVEWAEIFEEVWRRYRDFFYVKNLHGYDWEAIRAQYKPLLKHVAHRSDLNYVLSEMVSELSVGHAYIEGGDFEIPPRPKVALPGARFSLDTKEGHYKLTKIFKGHNEEDKYRSPLTEVGIDANLGDYIMAIDGVELKANDNPYQLLQHKTEQVTLTLNKNATTNGARKITYKPVTSEQSLLYLDWVDHNRKKVSEMSNGKVGYIHIPDMGGPGIYEFIKWYYPQIRKEGMIVDVRANGGGNVSQWIIERLDSKLLGTRFGYASDKPGTYPGTVFHGHMACLISETSGSDGDIFPYYFREAGLGPLIGKRTWGGVVGISGLGPLLDGGDAKVPLSASNDTNGKWIIEGFGVEPDIEIENEPKAILEGQDQQLERGVEEVLKMMRENPKRLPTRPLDPIKTK